MNTQDNTNIHTPANCSCPLCCPQKYMQPYQWVPSILNPPVNYGWVCPCCKSVYSPSTSQCWNCSPLIPPKVTYQSCPSVQTLTKEEAEKSGFKLTGVANSDPEKE